MLRAYAGYLFDLDGTLVDTAPDLNAALNHALQSAGLAPVDESLTRHWVGHGARVLVAQALKHQGVESHPVDPLFEAFLSYYAAHVAELSQPYPQVRKALSALVARGAKLAVVTNKLSRFTEALLPRDLQRFGRQRRLRQRQTKGRGPTQNSKLVSHSHHEAP